MKIPKFRKVERAIQFAYKHKCKLDAHGENLISQNAQFSYLYAKTVTLIPTHNERSNAVMMRNRRIGTSQSGIVQNFQKIGVREHFRWCDEGYKYINDLDAMYSDWLCVPRSIKKTTVKLTSGRWKIYSSTNEGAVSLFFRVS